MPELNELPVFSHKDILDAYKSYDCPEESREAILYFISELTGISVDSLSHM